MKGKMNGYGSRSVSAMKDEEREREEECEGRGMMGRRDKGMEALIQS